MNDADLFHRFALVSSVAAGAVVGGGGLLLFAPRTWVGRAVVAAVAVAVTTALTATLAAEFVGVVGGLGAGVAAVAVLASTPTVRLFVGRCARLFARPRVIGAVALFAAFGVWGYEAWRFDAINESRLDVSWLEGEMRPPPVGTVAHAVTDRGTPIDLAAPTDPLPEGELADLCRRCSAITLHAEQVITRGGPTDQSNCHGWVFTGGRFHVFGRQVDAILAENGYERVSEPTAGDVCVYRNSDGQVAHTGVVRASLSDGTVLVESKWGRMGVYLHGVGDSCYGTEFGYFRTARGTHLLNGLDDASTVTEASERP